MMTFKEYLIEQANVMSSDALKASMRDFEQRGIGREKQAKPSKKRLNQMNKRRATRYHVSAEEEEAKKPATRDVVKMIRNQREETDLEKPSDKRRGQRAARRLRKNYGRGNPNGLSFTEH
jgi:hypothetical protein